MSEIVAPVPSPTDPVEPAIPADSAHAPNPFTLTIDPRERLLVVDIAHDPAYAALELQYFDDARGRGLLALVGRHDGLVDFYRQPGLDLDRDEFSIGRGVGEWRVAEFQPARFAIGDGGLDVAVAFVDAAGRRVELTIDDRGGGSRRRSTLLAPVGSGVEEPHSLFAVLMRGFDLVPASARAARLTIDGVDAQIPLLPGIGASRRRMIRYSAEPVIAVLNANRTAAQCDMVASDVIDELRAGDGVRAARLGFQPAFPNLRQLPDGAALDGRWALDVADQRQLTGGCWTLRRRGDRADITMAVTEQWRPQSVTPMVRLVTTVARVFRTWPTTYRWSASVELAHEPPLVTSRWTRGVHADRANPYGLPRPARAAGAAALVATALLLLLSTRRRRSATGGELRQAP